MTITHGFRSLRRSPRGLRGIGVRQVFGLQNRNARFDSSVPRLEGWLYGAQVGSVEPNRADTPHGHDPHRSARIRCVCGGSVPRRSLEPTMGRLTRFGLNQLDNRWPTLWPLIRERRQRLEGRAGR